MGNARLDTDVGAEVHLSGMAAVGSRGVTLD
jgi:hypothetical protein